MKSNPFLSACFDKTHREERKIPPAKGELRNKPRKWETIQKQKWADAEMKWSRTLWSFPSVFST